jgi:hypothetical protein
VTTKTIPEHKIVTCDCCGVECTKDNRRVNGILHVKQDGLDYAGHAVGDNSIKLDLCDACLSPIVKAMNAAITERRATPKGGNQQ